MKKAVVKKLAQWFREYSQRKNEVTVERVLLAARKIMKSQKFCTLSTRQDEEIYSRVLQPFHPNADFVVRFGTSPTSRKAQQVKVNPRGTITYMDAKKGAAVSLMGHFEINTELDVRRKSFFQTWWAFFPEGPEGSDFMVMLFKPDRIEVWDPSRGITPEPFGLKSAAVVKAEDPLGWKLIDD